MLSVTGAHTTRLLCPSRVYCNGNTVKSDPARGRTAHRVPWYGPNFPLDWRLHSVRHRSLCQVYVLFARKQTTEPTPHPFCSPVTLPSVTARGPPLPYPLQCYSKALNSESLRTVCAESISPFTMSCSNSILGTLAVECSIFHLEHRSECGA